MLGRYSLLWRAGQVDKGALLGTLGAAHAWHELIWLDALPAGGWQCVVWQEAQRRRVARLRRRATLRAARPV